jgi:hypothetical protein
MYFANVGHCVRSFLHAKASFSSAFDVQIYVTFQISGYLSGYWIQHSSDLKNIVLIKECGYDFYLPYVIVMFRIYLLCTCFQSG